MSPRRSNTPCAPTGYSRISRQRWVENLRCWVAALAYLLPSGGLASEVTIGVLLPKEPIEARSIQRGIEIAVAKTRGTYPVRVLARTRGSQWGTEGQEAAELVLDENIQGLIAPSDGAITHVALQISGRTRVPVVSLCPDSSVSAAGIPWALHVAPATRDQAATLFTTMDAKKWCALVPADRSGEQAGKDLLAAASATRREFQVVVVPPATADGHSPDRDPSRETLNRAMESHPDGILIWLTDSNATQCYKRRLQERGFDGPLAVPFPAGDFSKWDCASNASQRGSCLRATAPARDENSRRACRAFADEYRQRYHEPPNVTAILAHDAAVVLLDNLESGAPLRDRHRAGASGPLKFNASGRRVLALTPTRTFE